MPALMQCIVCGTLSDKGRCPTHRTTTARGYGTSHQRRRAQWAPIVANGGVPCARCGAPIEPGAAWALDHTDRRDAYLGPSHAECNSRGSGIR